MYVNYYVTGEKRAAKKAREASTVLNPQLKPPSNQPIKILARQSEQPKSQGSPNNNNNNNTSQPQLLKPPTGPKRSPNQSPSPSPSPSPSLFLFLSSSILFYTLFYHLFFFLINPHIYFI